MPGKVGRLLSSNLICICWRQAAPKRVTQSEKIAMLLTFGGAELLAIYSSFDYNIEGAAAEIPTVKAVLDRFDSYFAPRTNELIDRYRFRSCKQSYDETTASYIARLHNLAKTCNFGDEKENNLRDQLVYGCHDDSLREKLFREETLTLHSASQIATAHEAALQNMNLFRGQTHDPTAAASSGVTKVKAEKARRGNTDTEVRWVVRGQRQTQGRCKFCGREHAFNRKQCPAFGKRCHICGQNNHFAKMCQTPKKRERDRRKNIDAQPQRQLEVDTGSAVSMIPVHVYESQFSNCQLQHSNKVFRSFTGESVPCKGMFRVHVQYKTNCVDRCDGCMLFRVANMYYLGETG
ncbi:hypothetical protein NP493_541g00005 [Ridgeia piscesae]|uniref:Uncharacterized protein n=1 Tax=Ridgeia piscesae TaxID=27915 RepID=A0AAD9NRX9_RIDPI|nr:hypothetical protein NP493_541g00005 [Ridgeia piscesae]